MAKILFSSERVNWFTLSAIQNYNNEKNVLLDIKIVVKQVYGAECKVVFWLYFLDIAYFQYFSKLKKCNMKRVQHEKSVTWKKWNMEKFQHEKSATRKAAT